MTAYHAASTCKAWAPNGRKHRLVQVQMTWVPDDPLTIAFTFSDGENEVEWTVSRDLLIDAAKSARLVGLGDFRARSDMERFWLLVGWSRNSGAVVEVPRDLVDHLLEESIREMPPGSDEELATLAAVIDDAIEQAQERGLL